MSETIKRPKRKNPILKTRAPTLPPDRRSRVALGLVRGAALGNLELQCCAACGAVQYPPREACVRCLSAELEWTVMSGRGELVSETTLHHSQELFFRERVPWRLGLVRLAEGVSLVAHLDARCGPAPSAVTVQAALDRAGQAVLIAKPASGETALADEPTQPSTDAMLDVYNALAASVRGVGVRTARASSPPTIAVTRFS